MPLICNGTVVMAFKTGDKVRFLHEKGEGIVKMILSSGKVVVEISEGLPIECAIGELVEIRAISLTEMVVFPKESTLKRGLRGSAESQSKPHAKGEKVVDLHFEKIGTGLQHFNDSQKLTHQLDCFQRELDRAIAGHLTKIIFVHGVGAGVLRNEIREILKGYQGIEYNDAPYQKFGAGATEVRIKARMKAR